MYPPGETIDAAMFVVLIVLGIAASACAVAAAYVYLRDRPGRSRQARERLARRWLLATAVLGFSIVALRFVWLLL